MKITLRIALPLLAAAFALPVTGSVIAQTASPANADQSAAASEASAAAEQGKSSKKKKGAQATTAPAAGSTVGAPLDTRVQAGGVAGEGAANRRELDAEDASAVLPYYNNFLSKYRLGPEDVISITVFGLDRYSRSGVTVPPDGRISHPLIPDGVFVVGKTTTQVAAEIREQLEEYVRDPKVSVSLDKAMSARYSVLGDVGQPGVRIMTRRLSVYEAVAEAGGVLSTGDKRKVAILRRQPDGNVLPIPVNLADIEKGRAKEMAFLVPGDQVVVPGNTFKSVQKVMTLLPILSFARIFTGTW